MPEIRFSVDDEQYRQLTEIKDKYGLQWKGLMLFGADELSDENEIKTRDFQQFLGLTYNKQEDQRVIPDADDDRFETFERGWQKAANGERFDNSTYESLSWRNLGWRLGRLFEHNSDNDTSSDLRYELYLWCVRQQQESTNSETETEENTFPERPNDNQQTVFCQTCQEWTHPRSNCGRNHDTAPLPIMKLKHSGPLVSSELKEGNGLNPESRQQHNVGKFNPMSSHQGPSDSTSFQTIYYLDNTHTKENVVERWMNINQEALRASGTTQSSLTYNISGEFTEAWNKIKERYDWLPTNQTKQSEPAEHGVQTCPNCGEEVKNLPRHIRACNE